MSIVSYSKFNIFKDNIQSLSTPLTKEQLIHPDTFFLKESENQKIRVYYAPFEHLNKNAKVVIVGITPGFSQMQKTYETVRSFKGEEATEEEILQEVKNQSSFQGPMRKNLVRLLDKLNLHTKLGLDTTNQLFDEHSHLVHTTSVLPYPVFYWSKGGWSNFSSQSDVIKNHFLYEEVINHLPKEINEMDNPLIIPLGKPANKAVTYLADNGYIKNQSILKRFPHTSGANQRYMIPAFEENYEDMMKTIEEHFSSK
ncbi:hypothetical protein IMZ31_05340 [Pontibacillus sp. ALD_SL1]|uniref:uracil-DNA glycosylase family protein n=1 Tax=Pontibacillus sp. ALD_SL1 TaxID=2777185 RepID=UPI001A977FA6|nr:uracil-DNA glycosylase family protein [Pontibacillus sp. ALD_SL1]QST00996.1 hypothetical protein IMZ31_05340 [Pontibacillus sp. ALD_SL1]